MKPARVRALKAAVFALAAAPLAKLAADLFLGRLGANPIEAILNRLGFWTLTLLTASLVPTPARALLGISWPIRVRRMLGLFAFAYATLHLVFYVAIDQALDLALLLQDVAKRKFMTVGFAAWLLLLPLAITSTDAWVRRLGFARWKRLHRLVYVAALLGVVHFVWRVKADLARPLLFAAVIGALLAVRAVGAAARLSTARAARTASDPTARSRAGPPG
jgi:sulfoxide reductase heme-binding subunit YedZ